MFDSSEIAKRVLARVKEAEEIRDHRSRQTRNWTLLGLLIVFVCAVSLALYLMFSPLNGSEGDYVAIDDVDPPLTEYMVP